MKLQKTLLRISASMISLMVIINVCFFFVYLHDYRCIGKQQIAQQSYLLTFVPNVFGIIGTTVLLIALIRIKRIILSNSGLQQSHKMMSIHLVFVIIDQILYIIALISVLVVKQPKNSLGFAYVVLFGDFFSMATVGFIGFMMYRFSSPQSDQLNRRSTQSSNLSIQEDARNLDDCIRSS